MIYIAIGANLPSLAGGSPLDTCKWAVRQLAALPGLRLCAIAPWYDTPPDPPSAQPRYVNGMAALHGLPEPAMLLGQLQGIEAHAGRVRGVANAARTLDLDIIDINGFVRTGPDPILPHPRAHLRHFVLNPLRDIAPEWQHPTLKHNVGELLARLEPSL